MPDTLRRFWRKLRASYLRAWRERNPLCSRCGSRVISSAHRPPECMCPTYAFIARAEAQAKMRKTAIAKLTPAERAALGL
jgi:tRNA(Ile2) C34 agmatinyltransferase TiaS